MMFRDALVSAYREEPCRVLPNAIWKTLAEVDNFETSFEVENRTHPEGLYRSCEFCGDDVWWLLRC